VTNPTTVDLIRRLVEAGTPADIIADVAAELARGEAARAALEERRAKDAERKRRLGVSASEWSLLRSAVFERDQYVCSYCGGDVSDAPQCDHIFPLSRGGKSTLDNLTTACASCNSSKRDKTPDEWRRA